MFSNVFVQSIGASNLNTASDSSRDGDEMSIIRLGCSRKRKSTTVCPFPCSVCLEFFPLRWVSGALEVSGVLEQSKSRAYINTCGLWMGQILWGAASNLIDIRGDMGHKTAATRAHALFVPSPNPNLNGFLFCLFLGNRNGSWGFAMSLELAHPT